MNTVALLLGMSVAVLGHYLGYPPFWTAIAALGVPAAILIAEKLLTNLRK